MENEGAGAKNNHRCFHGSNAFDDPNMGCLRAPTGVVDLHTLFQGREKNSISNFVSTLQRPGLKPTKNRNRKRN